MGSSVVHLVCIWLLASCLLTLTTARDAGQQVTDGNEAVEKVNRKLLHTGEDLGCSCSHEVHLSGECPCELDITWLKNGECPACPVYGCGECDPLKCDECKRCCEGTELSDDRQTCSCPTCDITKCLECDAMDCSKCLVCAQGYELDEERKCQCKKCHVDYCQKCDPENCYQCLHCNPFLELSSDGRSCNCPDCPINGCAKCSPKNCKECEVCADGSGPPCDECECKIPHCEECDAEKDCKVCKVCKPEYELVNYNTECKCEKCEVENCKECNPEDCSECIICIDGYRLQKMDKASFYEEYLPAPICECDVDPLPNCYEIDTANCTRCRECDVGYVLDYDGVCVCERCDVEQCQKCDTTKCDDCKVCLPGFNLTDTGDCVCATCGAANCQACSLDDCDKCEECKEGFVLDYDGQCVCNGCAIDHCTKCSSKDCTVCEKCDEGYGPSGTNECPCENCDVEHCVSCDQENCEACAECEEGYVLSDGVCVCDPKACTIDNCMTCNPDDCSTCGECKPPFVVEEYGGKCVCGSCDVDNCVECCPETNCTTCKQCEPGLVLNDDQTKCVCETCDVAYATECDPKDCTKPKKCEGKMEVSPDGTECVCKQCKVANCASCGPSDENPGSSVDCDTCNECELFFSMQKNQTYCKCMSEAIVGCQKADKNCKCLACREELEKSECGYCVYDYSQPGCDWNLVRSGGHTCDVVCKKKQYKKYWPVPLKVEDSVWRKGRHGKEEAIVWPCLADVQVPEGPRPGQTSVYNETYCHVELASPTYEFEELFQDRYKGSAAFLCVCQKEEGILTWQKREPTYTPDDDVYDASDPYACTGKDLGGCKQACENAGLEPLSVPGSNNKAARLPSGEVRLFPYSICRLEDEGDPGHHHVGYDVQFGQWCGRCASETHNSDEYDCLCSKPCTQPDCGYHQLNELDSMEDVMDMLYTTT